MAKRLFRLISVLLIVCIAMSMMSVIALANHISPVTKLPCTATDRRNVHDLYIGRAPGPACGWWTSPTGPVFCSTEGLIYNHISRCNSCNFNFGSFHMGCRQAHSRCGIKIILPCASS